jgi:hypothetical protein
MRHLFARPEARRHPGKQPHLTQADIAWTMIQVLAALASIVSFLLVFLTP